VNDDLRHIALAIFENGAFKDYRSSTEGGFKLALHRMQPEAPLSPFYLSLRTPENPKPGSLTPRLVELIGKELYRLSILAKIQYDCFVGIPNAGTPLADSFELAQSLDLPLKEKLLLEKRSGNQSEFDNALHGQFTAGQTVLLLDDLVSDAGSKQRAASQFRKDFHLKVNDCVVFVDRRPFRIRREEAASGLRIHACLRIEELADVYRMARRIPPEVERTILDYLEKA
jgi:orotate phosphoribosyltransferase